MAQVIHMRKSKYGKRFIAGRIKKIWYPSVEYVISVNRWVIENIPRPKAERHLVYSLDGIKKAIEMAKLKRGGLREKAAVLFREINRGHFFAGGNKTTGYLVASKFLFVNRGYIKLKQDGMRTRKFLVGVREGRYGVERIARWLDE